MQLNCFNTAKNYSEPFFVKFIIITDQLNSLKVCRHKTGSANAYSGGLMP